MNHLICFIKLVQLTDPLIRLQQLTAYLTGRLSVNNGLNFYLLITQICCTTSKDL